MQVIQQLPQKHTNMPPHAKMHSLTHQTVHRTQRNIQTYLPYFYCNRCFQDKMGQPRGLSAHVSKLSCAVATSVTGNPLFDRADTAFRHTVCGATQVEVNNVL